MRGIVARTRCRQTADRACKGARPLPGVGEARLRHGSGDRTSGRQRIERTEVLHCIRSAREVPGAVRRGRQRRGSVNRREFDDDHGDELARNPSRSRDDYGASGRIVRLIRAHGLRHRECRHRDSQRQCRYADDEPEPRCGAILHERLLSFPSGVGAGPQYRMLPAHCACIGTAVKTQSDTPESHRAVLYARQRPVPRGPRTPKGYVPAASRPALNALVTGAQPPAPGGLSTLARATCPVPPAASPSVRPAQ